MGAFVLLSFVEYPKRFRNCLFQKDIFGLDQTQPSDFNTNPV